MRKIIYSRVLKTVAVLLFCACIVLGALTVTGAVVTFYNEEDNIYSFESDFSKSWYVSMLLNEPEWTLVHAYHEAFPDYLNGKGNAERAKFVEANPEIIAESIKKAFDDFYYDDKLNYYVEYNGTVITNCGAKSAEELMAGDCYSYVKRDAAGNVDRWYTGANCSYYIEELISYDTKNTITVSCSVKEDVISKCEAIWLKQEKIVIDTVLHAAIFAFAAILLLVYLICVCGKNKDGEYKNMWVDKIWLEAHLVFAGVAGFSAVLLCANMIDALIGNRNAQIALSVIGTAAGAASFIVITSILSVVRNIKTERFLKTSIVIRVLTWIWRVFVKILKWTWRKTKASFKALKRALSLKTGAIVILMLFVYTALIGALGIVTYHSPIGLILAVLLFLFACIVVAYRAKDLDDIKRGAREIRGGNTGYKIAEVKSEDMKALAEDVNDIARGLDESVAAKVKAERMKSELITNVSHDLKTPITSIISYAELLAKTEGLSEEAKDYVAVIAKKGERLKKLTQDLFDVSKAHSGNDEAVLERLDASLLIEQSLAEHEREIQSSGFVFCTQVQKELYILADGRKMSRVLGNLIDNVLKYTLKSTRVFITAAEKDGKVEIEFKNVSAFPLDFDAEEITGRFVRGDSSRTLEGNGLGLAIAKSYTELCGGIFGIELDGDMFKVRLTFKKLV